MTAPTIDTAIRREIRLAWRNMHRYRHAVGRAHNDSYAQEYSWRAYSEECALMRLFRVRRAVRNSEVQS